MPPHPASRRVEGLVSHAREIDRSLALYRAALDRVPAHLNAPGTASDPGLEELEALLVVVEDLWRAVSGRTARIQEEMLERLLAAEVERELSMQGEKWHRYLNFAAAAGIAVPAPLN